MKKIFKTYRPDGFSTVNSYLFTEQPEKLISFLTEAFYATEVHRTVREDTGEIANCIMKIGDTAFMISQATGSFKNMRTALYLYVSDVDLMHQKAISAGAKVVFNPEDMDYGDRQSGIEDPAGNYWWISQRLVHKGY